MKVGNYELHEWLLPANMMLACVVMAFMTGVAVLAWIACILFALFVIAFVMLALSEREISNPCDEKDRK